MKVVQNSWTLTVSLPFLSQKGEQNSMILVCIFYVMLAVTKQI